METLLSTVKLADLSATYTSAQPFPHVVIDGFIEPSFAREVAACYPTFEDAGRLGFSFNAVNERKKIQITDQTRFPPAVRRLSDFLAEPAFLADLSALTGIPNLLADETLFGGGMHMTGPHGRLDVHVDFNLLDNILYRRLNLLVYLNPEWDESWGGQVELWDREVQVCATSLSPVLGRWLIFETSDISFHGVAPLTCPPDQVRRSFAVYYCTADPPPNARSHELHSTIFRARPDERLRGYILDAGREGEAMGARRREIDDQPRANAGRAGTTPARPALKNEVRECKRR
jgi:hypothetical protein